MISEIGIEANLDMIRAILDMSLPQIETEIRISWVDCNILADLLLD